MLPKIIKTISINDKSKRYYTGYVEKKHHLYGFTTDSAIDDCIFFLGTYKSRYGKYPDINDSERIEIKTNLIPQINRQSLLSIIDKELIITDENTEDLIQKCSVMGIGLLLINNFEFNLSDKQIDIKFSARSLIPEEKIRNYLTFEEDF